MALSAATLHAERIVLDVETRAQKGLYPMAVPKPITGDPTLAQLLVDVQTFNFEASGWFRVLDPRSFLANLKDEGMSLKSKPWKDIGAYGVIKAQGTVQGSEAVLQFQLYELEQGIRPVLTREYRGHLANARHMIHRFCNEVVQYYTGKSSFFGSEIAFSVPQGRSKAIYVMDFDGHGPRPITRNDSVNILPAWHPYGKELVFTSYMRHNPDLYRTTWPPTRPVRLSQHPGMNTGAAYSPDGETLAITLSHDGNPEIYLLRAKNGAVFSRLTTNWYIDTSPSWSPDGKEIAFVSDREGGPQIFVMNRDGTVQRRVSSTGKFNQTPKFCPMVGTRLLAYTTRDDTTGNFDIVTLDLNTQKMVRVTQNQGNNDAPTWSPDGRVLAFASRRSEGRGIYLANADGTGKHRWVFRGAASSPAWGPVPKFKEK